LKVRSRLELPTTVTLEKAIAAIFLWTCAPLKQANNPVAVEIAANHVATSLLSLIEWWLENKMAPPPAQMGKIYKGLIIDSTVEAVISLSLGMAGA